MPLAQFHKMEEFSCQFLATDLVPFDTVNDPEDAQGVRA